jgi:hypothetical protein
MAATCAGCGAALDLLSAAGFTTAGLCGAGCVVELDSPSQPSAPARGGVAETGRTAAAAPGAAGDGADRCLRCRKQAPGTHYPFFVALRHSPLRRIIHEERAFICDRCAAAQVRFAPLVALFLWVPVLALAVLRYRHSLVTLPLLLFVTAGVLRLVFRQLRACRGRRFRQPPFSEAVARLAIRLRQREVLRSLHWSAADVVFLTDAGGGDQPPDGGAGGRSVASRECPLSLT